MMMMLGVGQNVSPLVPLIEGMQLANTLENLGHGLQWNNLMQNDFPHWSNNAPIWCLYHIAINATLFGAVGFYIDNVFPGEMASLSTSKTYWSTRMNQPTTLNSY